MRKFPILPNVQQRQTKVQEAQHIREENDHNLKSKEYNQQWEKGVTSSFTSNTVSS
jgi:hypothetical protein